MKRPAPTRRWHLRAATIAATGLLAALAPISVVGAARADNGGDPPPKGANNWACRSATHPTPVVLVHGTTANQNQNWATLSPALTDAGYCVYTFTYGVLPALPGIGGLGPFNKSVKRLAQFVGTVRKRTGADKLDFVGHSQGAAVQMAYLRDYEGAKHARRVINFAGVVSGPPAGALGGLLGLAPGAVGTVCPACATLGDPATYRIVNYPNVQYVNIASNTDEVVQPPSVSFMKPAPNVRNVLVQSYCPGMMVGHDAMSKNPTVRRIIMNGLDPATAQPVPCGPNDPF